VRKLVHHTSLSWTR